MLTKMYSVKDADRFSILQKLHPLLTLTFTDYIPH